MHHDASQYEENDGYQQVAYVVTVIVMTGIGIIPVVGAVGGSAPTEHLPDVLEPLAHASSVTEWCLTPFRYSHM